MSREDGYKNLVPLSQRTPEEQRSFHEKGGRQSGKIRRKKRDAAQYVKMMSEAAVTDETISTQLKAMGLEESDHTYGATIAAQLIRRALKGDLQAARLYFDICEKAEQKAQLEKERKKSEKFAEAHTPADELSKALFEMSEGGENATGSEAT